MILPAIALPMLLSIAPQTELPVQVENSSFRISVDGQVIGKEEFSISRNGDGYLATGRVDLRVGGQQFEATSTMQLDENLHPLHYEYRSGEQAVRLEVGDDTTEFSTTVDGEPRTLDVRFDSDGAIVEANFFHHYQLILYRLGVDGGSIPTLVPQQMSLGPLNVRVLGNRSYELSTDNLRLEATTDAAGRLLRLRVPDANVVVER